MAFSLRTTRFKRLSFWVLSAVVMSLFGPGSALRPAHGQICTSSESVKLYRSDGGFGESFGVSVSLDGDTLLVGSFRDPINGTESGSATVFRFDGVSWNEEQKLVAPDGIDLDRFGVSVAIEGEVAILGSRGADEAGFDAGAVYVFRFDGMMWQMEQKLLRSDAAAGDNFGSAVALNGEVILAGSLFDGREGNGSATVFRYDGNSWLEEQKLEPRNSAPFDNFGSSVALDENLAIVGAFSPSGGGAGQGFASVFRFDGISWIEEQRLTPDVPESFDWFGDSVAVEGNLAAVGAPRHDGATTDSGSLFLFRSGGAGWIQEQEVSPADGENGGFFGTAVSIESGVVLVGRQAMSSSASVYVRRGATWIEEERLAPSVPKPFDSFGLSLELQGGIGVVGALQGDGRIPDTGAVYLFPIDGCPISACLAGTVNAGGGNLREVLLLNGDGGGPDGEVDYCVLQPLELRMLRPPAVPPSEAAPFAVYAWPGRPQRQDLRLLPFGIGCTAMPTPLSFGSPQPSVIWNNAGRNNLLGRATRPSQPAPSIFYRRERTLESVGVFTVQGLIYDPAALASIPASVTNGIIARPVFCR